ncbi:ferritin-like domain-containing protein [Undibacterium fentianense]|uniref:Ferritin-like protein n=1 Tax=Undibacterium fentianense TaxID=2828728 RepID=A0A941DZB8_9BURK|nr:ferritin-like protein [Undibacterium fentianense]MBR7800274.1 ferritin-like protein [Undibacterium fentianense]
MSQSIFQSHNHHKRHQLLAVDLPREFAGTITTIESLREHLQTAVELEHSTIPPYLCALYSLKSGSNTFAMQTIQSVVMEEMLHMILAANILNAIGGAPAMNTPDFIPKYPTYLPHSDDAFLVSLGKFSPATVDTFLQIEHPAPEGAPPEADHYATIGQFYSAIKHALRYLDHITPGGIFTGDVQRQISAQHYYGGGGKLLAVTCLDDAILAINEIIGQGEGINGTIMDSDHRFFGEEIEYAHFFKYKELQAGRRYLPTDKANAPPTGPAVEIDWNAVYDMQDNPKMGDYEKGSEIWTKTFAFNRTYMQLLNQLHDACNGKPESLRQAIPLMYDLKYKAMELMQIPTPNGKMAGPSFEYVPL